MSKEAIEHYEAALKEAFPSGASGDVFHHWNEARKALAEQPAQQQSAERGEPKAYIHRQGNHWEVSERMLLDDEKACGWTEEPLYTSPPNVPTARASKPLTDEQKIAEALRRHGLTLVKTTSGYDALKLGQIDAHGIKENT